MNALPLFPSGLRALPLALLLLLCVPALGVTALARAANPDAPGDTTPQDRELLQQTGHLMEAGKYTEIRQRIHAHLQATHRLPPSAPLSGGCPAPPSGSETDPTGSPEPSQAEHIALTATLQLALGNALYMEGELKDAYAAFCAARQGLPQDPAACRNLALAAYGLERWVESAELFELASSLGPKPDPALLRQAATAWSLGHRPGPAAQAIHRALALVPQPDPAWLALHAQLHTQAGKHAQGLAPLLAALNQTPHDPALWLTLADAEWRGKRPSQAAAALETVLLLLPAEADGSASGKPPSSRTLLDRLARTYAQGGLPALAAERIPAQPNPMGSDEINRLEQQAALYARAHRPLPALEALETAQQHHPETSRLLRMARLCLHSGLDRRAVNYLSPLLAQQAASAPEHGPTASREQIREAALLVALGALNLEDRELARSALARIPAHSPEHAYAARLLELLETPHSGN
jgi:hypothetical protein